MNVIPVPAIGDVGHVRHMHWWPPISGMIHFALNKWHRSWCRRHIKQYKEVLGTHDFIVVPCKESKYDRGAGESLAAKGTVITPWEVYLERIKSGECEVWIFDTGFTWPERCKCVEWWGTNCLGKSYDWRAIKNLLLKIMFSSFSDKLKDGKFAFFCTESVQRTLEQVKNVYQCKHATPMHTEQVAGMLSRKDGTYTSLTLKFKAGKDGATW